MPFSIMAERSISRSISTPRIYRSALTTRPAVQFTGTEETFYGIGSIDGFTNLADISGAVTLTTTSAPTARRASRGITKRPARLPAAAPLSEKLYLIDANDGGTAMPTDQLGSIGRCWRRSISPASTSGWHKLSISVDPSGTGVAPTTTRRSRSTRSAGLVGEFYVGYRENTQAGAVGVPSYLRPATFADVPEPSALLLCTLAGLPWLRRRRR